MTLGMKTSLKFPVAIVSTVLAVGLLGPGGCSRGSTSAGKEGEPASSPATVEVKDAWCRPTPNGATTGACFMTLTAEGAPETLLSAASPAAAMVQLHAVSTSGDVMQMQEMTNGQPLPENQAVTLAPGGNHLMLLKLTRPLVAGETVSLTLGFQRIAPIAVQAEVRLPQVDSGNPAPARK
jgi:Uncharacterized protein conserved in bacteria